MEGNEEKLLFAFSFNQEATSALTVTVCGILTNLQFVKRLTINAFLSNL
jgi:hypothetical protein